MNRMSGTPRGAALPVIVLLLLAPAGAARGVEPPAAPPPPGRLVDAGGYRLHLHCTGTGRPTVVLAAGLGDYSIDWGLVQPRVARFTRVCSYDRAGYAWSDPDPRPRSLQRAVDELQALLTNAEIPGPYVLVGHSWGGHIARVFAAQHRDAVAGMVLVDSSHEDRLEVINGQAVRPRRLSRQELEALFDAEMVAMHAGGPPGGPPGGAPGSSPAPGPSPGSAPALAPTPRPIEPPYDRLPA